MVIVIIKMNAMPYKRRLWPKKTAGLIKKETDEHPTSNVQRRILYSIDLIKEQHAVPMLLQ